MLHNQFSFAEKAVICHFIAFALLLLTRDLGTTDGWSVVFKDGYTFLLYYV